jgi:hypothetical protein
MPLTNSRARRSRRDVLYLLQPGQQVDSISYARSTGDSGHRRIGKVPHQQGQGVFVKQCICVKGDDYVRERGSQSIVQRRAFACVLLAQTAHTRVGGKGTTHNLSGVVDRPIIDDNDFKVLKAKPAAL